MGNPIGSVKSVSNADDVFENGVYHVAQDASGSIQNVVLSVFKSPLVVSGKYFISQIAHGTGNEIKMRQMWYGNSSSEWSPWHRIDNFGYNSLAELSAGVSPYLFAGVGNKSGLKSGSFSLKTGESTSIALGAGILMLFTDGGQVFSLFGINYWTTEIKTIYTDGRSLHYNITKNDTSNTVTFTATSNRTCHYIFFGE